MGKSIGAITSKEASAGLNNFQNAALILPITLDANAEGQPIHDHQMVMVMVPASSPGEDYKKENDITATR